MKKKIIPAVALAAILGLGVTGLASCNTEKPSIPGTTETVAAEHGISVTNEKGVKLTASKYSAKKDEVITVTATVEEGATLRGLKATGITFTAVTGETNKWTFTMPDASVAITPDADAPVIKDAHGISVTNEKGITLKLDKTSAKAGETVKVSATVISGAKLRGLKATGITFTAVEDATYTWTFTMPDSAVLITVDADAPATTNSYRIDYKKVEGVTLTVPGLAKEGETVTITAEVTDDTITVASIDGSESGVIIDAVEGVANKWTFTMPSADVTFKIITEAVTKDITIDSTTIDESSATLFVTHNQYATSGTSIKKGNVGEIVYVKQVLAKESNKQIVSVKVNDIEAKWNSFKKAWTFTMPNEAVTIKATYGVTATAGELFKFSNRSINEDTAKFYINISEPDDFDPVEALRFDDTHKVAYSLVTGKTYAITLENFEEAGPSEKITSFKIGDVEVTLTTEDNITYTGTFVAPKTASEITVVTEAIDVGAAHTISYDLVDELNYEFTNEKPLTVNDGEEYYIQFMYFNPDESSTLTIDCSKSGAYTEDGTLIQKFDCQYGSMYTLTVPNVTKNLTIKTVLGTPYQAKGYTGSWYGEGAIAGGDAKAALSVEENGNFKLVMNKANNICKGKFEINYEDDLVYNSENGEISIKVTQVDGLLIVFYKKNATECVYALGAPTDFIKVNSNLTKDLIQPISEEKIGIVTKVGDNKWLVMDLENQSVQAAKMVDSEEYDVTSFDLNEVYTIKFSDPMAEEPELKVRYYSGKLQMPGQEKGAYTWTDGAYSTFTLDGHGTWTSDYDTGKYKINNVTGVLTLEPLSYGETYPLDIDIIEGTATDHVSKTDALSGKYFTFETIDTSVDTSNDSKTVEITFNNSDDVTVKLDSSLKKSDYLLKGNALELYVGKNLIKWTYDTTKETLTHVSGELDNNSTLKGITTTVSKMNKILTPADESVTGNLVLKTDGTATVNGGESSAYTMDYSKGEVTHGGQVYKVDFAAGTYKIVKLDTSFIANKKFEAKETMQIPSDGESEPEEKIKYISITFGEAKTITSLTITYLYQTKTFTLEEEPYVYSDYKLNKSNLTYTVDEKAATMSITLGDGEVLVLKIDDKAKTLSTTVDSQSLTDDKLAKSTFQFPSKALTIKA